MNKRYKLARTGVMGSAELGRAFLFPALLGLFAWWVVTNYVPESYFLHASMLGTVVGFIALLRFYLSMESDGSFVVGRDGLNLMRGDRHRFISFDDIREVRFSTWHEQGYNFYGVALYLQSEERVVLATNQMLGKKKRAQRMLEHIQKQHEAYHQTDACEAGSLASIVRGQRSPEGWLSHLRGVGAGVGTHRQPALAPEALWDIVESPVAAPIVRARAIAALGADLDQPQQKRLRIALQESAAPLLRIALEGALEQDDLALGVALCALEDERKQELDGSRAMTLDEPGVEEPSVKSLDANEPRRT